MLVNGEFTQIRRGPFTGEIVIAEEIYQYRYPYYLPESILFLPTYNDYYSNSMVKIYHYQGISPHSLVDHHVLQLAGDNKDVQSIFLTFQHYFQ